MASTTEYVSPTQWRYPQTSELGLHERATGWGASKQAQHQVAASGLQQRSAWDTTREQLYRNVGDGDQSWMNTIKGAGAAGTNLAQQGMTQRANIFGQDEQTKVKLMQQMHKNRMKAWASRGLASEIGREYE